MHMTTNILNTNWTRSHSNLSNRIIESILTIINDALFSTKMLDRKLTILVRKFLYWFRNNYLVLILYYFNIMSSNELCIFESCIRLEFSQHAKKTDSFPSQMIHHVFCGAGNAALHFLTLTSSHQASFSRLARELSCTSGSSKKFQKSEFNCTTMRSVLGAICNLPGHKVDHGNNFLIPFMNNICSRRLKALPPFPPSQKSNVFRYYGYIHFFTFCIFLVVFKDLHNTQYWDESCLLG